MVGKTAGVRSANRPPSPAGKLCGRVRSSHSGGASGGFGRRGTTEVRAGGAGPARPCEGGVAQSAASGTRGTRVPAAAAAAAAPAAAAPTAAAAARASRAGYINTRFHTPELTSAGPAQPARAGGASSEPAGDVGPGGGGGGRRPSSANRVRCTQRGALTRASPEPMAAQRRTGRPPSPVLSLPSPRSPRSPLPPRPLLRQPRPPGLGEELFLEEPRDGKTIQWEEAIRGDWH
ncbi:uncharacterized protein LOC106993810 [Macaca mulatta]